MNKFILPLVVLSILVSCSPNTVQPNDEKTMKEVVIQSLDFAAKQSKYMAASLEDQPGRLPKSTDRFGNLETCNSAWWVSGFFPGQLWYMYEYTEDESFKALAHEFSMRVEDQQFTTDNHDVGFMIFCSFGNGYRLTNNEAYLSVIHNAAKSLITRYSDVTKTIQSWDMPAGHKWQYPVIIDNMMNLELLLWVAEQFNDPKFADIANTHALTTIKNHYRADYSSYHVISYDTLSGEVDLKNTAQGFSDDSAWARGNAWGFYGYVMMYQMTKNKTYLDQAIKIADFLLNHPNMPQDYIPYWDYNAPNIPDTYRDVSAGAIICSALIALSQEVDEDLEKEYMTIVEKQLRALSTSTYRNAENNNGNFILKHSVGHMPNNTEVDKPLSYADYYFVEALMRYKKLQGL